MSAKCIVLSLFAWLILIRTTQVFARAWRLSTHLIRWHELDRLRDGVRAEMLAESQERARTVEALTNSKRGADDEHGT